MMKEFKSLRKIGTSFGSRMLKQPWSPQTKASYTTEQDFSASESKNFNNVVNAKPAISQMSEIQSSVEENLTFQNDKKFILKGDKNTKGFVIIQNENQKKYNYVNKNKR